MATTTSTDKTDTPCFQNCFISTEKYSAQPNSVPQGIQIALYNISLNNNDQSISTIYDKTNNGIWQLTLGILPDGSDLISLSLGNLSEEPICFYQSNRQVGADTITRYSSQFYFFFNPVGKYVNAGNVFLELGNKVPILKKNVVQDAFSVNSLETIAIVAADELDTVYYTVGDKNTILGFSPFTRNNDNFWCIDFVGSFDTNNQVVVSFIQKIITPSVILTVYLEGIIRVRTDLKTRFPVNRYVPRTSYSLSEVLKITATPLANYDCVLYTSICIGIATVFPITNLNTFANYLPGTHDYYNELLVSIDIGDNKKIIGYVSDVLRQTIYYYVVQQNVLGTNSLTPLLTIVDVPITGIDAKANAPLSLQSFT